MTLGFALKEKNTQKAHFVFYSKVVHIVPSSFVFLKYMLIFLTPFHANYSLFPGDKLSALIGANTNVEWKAKEKALNKNLQIAIKKRISEKEKRVGGGQEVNKRSTVREYSEHVKY